MARPAPRKVHFAPLDRQEREIRKLLREGRYRNVTHFMRCAIDGYLERIGRVPLTEQARQMAEDWSASQQRDAIARPQDASRDTDESW